MRPLTFSTAYPSYHPRKGQPTYFPQLIQRGFVQMGKDSKEFWEVVEEYVKEAQPNNKGIPTHICKYHTIRAGKRWKAGDWFKPVIWSGRPYHTPQIQFAPPIQIVKVWDYDVEVSNGFAWFYINLSIVAKLSNYSISCYQYGTKFLTQIAANDGLTLADFLAWFKHPKPFSGQIICWSDKINY